MFFKVHLLEDEYKSEVIQNDWKIVTWSKDMIENEIIKLDETTGSQYYENYVSIQDKSDKIDFLKYFVLFSEGGVFYAGDSVDLEYEFPLIIEMVSYCERRNISLFDSPSVIIPSTVFHPGINRMCCRILTPQYGSID